MNQGERGNPPVIECRMLGPVEMIVDDTTRPLGGPKQRAVLAMLAINRNRPLSAQTLATTAWDGRPPPDYRGSVQVVISNLRKLISDSKIEARSVLASAPPGYRLTLSDERCDVGRFQLRKKQGFKAAADHRFEEAFTHFTHALQEWRGEALNDLRGMGFADSFAAAMQEDQLAIITARAESEIACGHVDAVISELTPIVERHALREPLWAQLITALYLGGRQSDALGTCRRLRSLLAAELGIDPSPRIQELESSILRQEALNVRAKAAATAAVAMTIVDDRQVTNHARLHDRTGRVFPINATETSIGRMPDNDVVLDDGNVSRHHAVIVGTTDTYVIRDLHSSNGTYVGGQRVVNSAALSHDDVIRIGHHELAFEISG
ncbi:BTAD domain-containing putative transcriptional regulator [Rhodococcus tibetensis]|uniref:FHA domain-containing protein n=1 Tax=Rhodococcus tibetensis TaxID=2965064 RepID=A0ABT1QIL2_9NOCA|nr:BTAD domain-containing putative transcriptional regulator [Rhodococcus sp. FXJ9.536]MCQ4120942.1 FHA domain-containing protein [Rhodococcus sp. FXJ9.536]